VVADRVGETPCVFLAGLHRAERTIATQHYAMLQRNLLYTGVTRGKRLVVLVGQKKAVAIAVRNVSGRRRWSKLRGWLSADASKGA
jgi:exodeoxyribonuclease V alpha subunit